MSDCCAPNTAGTCGCQGSAPAVRRVNSKWAFADYLGAVAVRLSDRARNNYAVTPGLYALGHPASESPVFASANYKLSFDVLRRALSGTDAWILVLDTRGINVWCAAGKGTFGTMEFGRQIILNNLKAKVTHDTIIVPQLGASNLRAHEIKKFTGFNVVYGPVRARDIPQYLQAGNHATPKMRTVEFSWLDRLILTPMELVQGFKYAFLFLLLLFILLGFSSRPFSLSQTWIKGEPLVWAAVGALLAGALLTPLLLPILPFRSFAAKGLVAGLALFGIIFGMQPQWFDTLPSAIFMASFLPGFSSFLALNFTGATTFTNPSGVKREMKIAIPGYLIVGTVALVSLVAFMIRNWRS
jgi:hypothetical protein